MSDIKLPQIEPALASPMMLFQVSECEVLNRQLVEEAEAMRASSPGVNRSNHDGWYSEGDFFGRTESNYHIRRRKYYDRPEHPVLNIHGP